MLLSLARVKSDLNLLFLSEIKRTQFSEKLSNKRNAYVWDDVADEADVVNSLNLIIDLIV